MLADYSMVSIVNVSTNAIRLVSSIMCNVSRSNSKLFPYLILFL
jgi:hypothetical protein